MPGLDAYQNSFLSAESNNVMDLFKAMQAGQITGRDTTNLSLTQEPLKMESLEATLKLLDYRDKDVKLHTRMPKMEAFNTVEEFLQLESYGDRTGGFYREGELSDVKDSRYKRRSVTIKYIQVTGQVTVQAQMVRSWVPAMKKEIENKAMIVKQIADRALTKGNSDIIPEEWDSLYKQQQSVGVGEAYLYATQEDYFSSNIVIDLRGKSLKQEDVETGAVNADDNYGSVSDLFAPPSVISALAKDYYQDQRILMDANTAFKGMIGTVPKAIATTMGDVALMSDKFMKADPSKKIATAIADTKAPAAPTAGSNPALVVDALSKYGTGTGETGAIRYAVSAINRFGESALTLLGAADITVTLGNAIDLNFTATAGAYETIAYKIYRTKPGNSTTADFYPIFQVSASQVAAGYDGAAAGSVRDRGRILPDTEQAFLTEMSTDVLSMKELAPISKVDLAQISMSRQFVTLYYAAPALYAPKKFIKYINVAKNLAS